MFIAEVLKLPWSVSEKMYVTYPDILVGRGHSWRSSSSNDVLEKRAVKGWLLIFFENVVNVEEEYANVCGEEWRIEWKSVGRGRESDRKSSKGKGGGDLVILRKKWQQLWLVCVTLSLSVSLPRRTFYLNVIFCDSRSDTSAISSPGDTALYNSRRTFGEVFTITKNFSWLKAPILALSQLRHC